MGTNWVEIASLATGAGALVTAGLALATTRIASRTKSLADETRRLAAATEEDVSASWRPVVICPDALRVPPNEIDHHGVSFGAIKVRLANAGRGPAINVHVSAESRAIKDRIRTEPVGFGVILPGHVIDVTFPGHVIRDPGTQTLAFTIKVFYSDLAHHVFETDLRFIDPTPGLPHSEEIVATLASFDFQPRPGATLPVYEDAPDDETPVLPPQSHDPPTATAAVLMVTA